MAKKEDIDIILKIQSNVDYPMNINVMGNPYNALDTVNATTEYRWNITAFSFTSEDYVSVEYKVNAASAYTLFTAQLSNQSIESVIASLNKLGIGIFTSYTELGQTYIGTYNDNYTFGVLNIYNSATTTLVYDYNTASAGGDNSIDVNGVNIINLANPVTLNDLSAVSTNDTIDVFGTSSSAAGGTTVSVYNTTDSTYLYNQVIPANTAYSYSFTVQAGIEYLVSVSD